MAIDLQKVGFTSLYNTEKIVKVFEGTFEYDVDTTSRAFDFATAEVYLIPHGFTRPVFTELFWSLNDVEYYVGGGLADIDDTAFAISYSDSDNVGIMVLPYSAPIASGTVIYYKVVCGWINDYDDTDPMIEAFSDFPDTYRLNFNSRYQTSTIATEGKFTLTTASGTVTDVFDSEEHGLNYTPIIKCYYNAFPGEVWPLNYGGAKNPYLVDASDQVEGLAFVDATSVTVDAVMKAGSGEVNFWYMLYTPVDTLLTTSNSGDDVGI